jgi:hypothetical protein
MNASGGFSVRNVKKLAYIKLNTQTPCPSRGAVTVYPKDGLSTNHAPTSAFLGHPTTRTP